MNALIPRSAAGVGIGIALGTALTLGAQAIADRPLARTQQGPEGFNHLGAGVAGLGGIITGATIGARAGSAAVAWPLVLGSIAGAATGAYLLAPSIRRWAAEH
jgi:hypothetical protein